MAIWFQLTVNGLIAGSIYALVACGFSLIYKTNRFMHFAHGAVVTAAAYLIYMFFSLWKINFLVSVFFTLIVTAGIGLLSYRLIYEPLQKRKSSNVILLIASLGILILLENLIQLIYGADVKTIGLIPVSRGLDIFGALITPLQLVIMGVSISLFIGLYFFLKFTSIGRDMRAVADNRQLAQVIGINYKRIADYSLILGSILAGIAGILIGLEQNLVPTMGTMLIIKGFTGAVIGGLLSVPASVLGSYILGLVENYGIWFLPSGYKDAIAFVLLFLFLLLRPKGLFGKKRVGE